MGMQETKQERLDHPERAGLLCAFRGEAFAVLDKATQPIYSPGRSRPVNQKKVNTDVKFEFLY